MPPVPPEKPRRFMMGQPHPTEEQPDPLMLVDADVAAHPGSATSQIAPSITDDDEEHQDLPDDSDTEARPTDGI